VARHRYFGRLRLLVSGLDFTGKTPLLLNVDKETRAGWTRLFFFQAGRLGPN
jgi:hypothetical protein